MRASRPVMSAGLVVYIGRSSVMAAIIRSAARRRVTACGDDGCDHAAVDAGCGLAAFRERPPGARV